MSKRGLLAHVAAVALSLALLVAASFGETWRYGAISAANLLAAVVIAVQARRRVRAERAGWALALAGVVVLLVHNVRNQLALAATGSPDVGVVAVATLVLGYVLLLAGGALATVPVARRDLAAMLDVAVVGFGTASLLWAAFLQPAHLRLGSSPLRMAYELVLVLLVTALTGLVLRVVVVAPEARVTTLLLLLAMVSTNVAVVVFTVTEDPATGLSSWWASALCVLALLALAAALAHPSAVRLSGGEQQPRGLTPARLAFIAVALSVSPALAGVQSLLGHPVDAALLSIGSLVMVPLVVLRIGLLARGYADAAGRLRDLARLDELTGLPNRRALTAHLTDVLLRVADGSVAGVAVLYVDLDDFKAVNDTHGHLAGDEVLRAVGAGLRSCVRRHDLVARCGGDEFVVVLEGATQDEQDVVVGHIAQALSRPGVLGRTGASGTASVGAARVAAGERIDCATLLSRADAEMYRLKRIAQARPRPDEGAPVTVGATAPAPAVTS